MAAECGVRVGGRQIQVEVSCQVFDPHGRVLGKQALAARQLLLHVLHIQLTREKTSRLRLQKQHVYCAQSRRF